jgi:hypothetical protein
VTVGLDEHLLAPDEAVVAADGFWNDKAWSRRLLQRMRFKIIDEKCVVPNGP